MSNLPKVGSPRRYYPEVRNTHGMWKSETHKCRERLSVWCTGNGIDVGYGGDPIVPEAITIDLTKPYGAPGWQDPKPQNIMGDGRTLNWFQDQSLDYVFSSHLFEDFKPEEMLFVLFEWLRVLKSMGKLIIYCPDEQKYQAYCKANNASPNANHKIPDFSLKYFKEELLARVPDYVYLIVNGNKLVEEYSFEIVLQKRDQWRYRDL